MNVIPKKILVMFIFLLHDKYCSLNYLSKDEEKNQFDVVRLIVVSLQQSGWNEHNTKTTITYRY